MAKIHELFSTVFYIAVSLIFTLLSLAMIAYAMIEVWNSLGQGADLIYVLLDSVGLVVVSVAVFDVAKFLKERERLSISLI
jgi:hypothetical protein